MGSGTLFKQSLSYAGRSSRTPLPFEIHCASLSYFSKFREQALNLQKKTRESLKKSPLAQSLGSKLDETSKKIGNSRLGVSTHKVYSQLPNFRDLGSEFAKDVKNLISPEKKVYSRRGKEEMLKKQQEDGVAPEQQSDYPEFDGAEPSKSTDLLNVEQPKTKWESLKEKVTESSLYKSTESIRSKFRKSDAYKKSVDVGDKLQDRVEDMREVYETSQNPLIWKVREVTDTFMEESDAAAAIREIQIMDPDFTIPGLLQELEEYMIPKVTKAYLRADMDTLKKVCVDNALRNVTGDVTKRHTLGWVMDDRILDVTHIDFHDALFLDGDEPVVTITYICQHVDCVKDLSGKIIEGSESKIKTVHYTWVMKKELECPDFNWKIVDIGVQGIAGLL